MDNIEYVIQEFFKEYSGLDSLVNSGLIVCRRDGIPLYSFKSSQTEFDTDTAGALIAGVWQASSVLSQFIPDETEDDFRFIMRHHLREFILQSYLETLKISI